MLDIVAERRNFTHGNSRWSVRPITLAQAIRSVAVAAISGQTSWWPLELVNLSCAGMRAFLAQGQSGARRPFRQIHKLDGFGDPVAFARWQ